MLKSCTYNLSSIKGCLSWKETLDLLITNVKAPTTFSQLHYCYLYPLRVYTVYCKIVTYLRITIVFHQMRFETFDKSSWLMTGCWLLLLGRRYFYCLTFFKESLKFLAGSNSVRSESDVMKTIPEGSCWNYAYFSFIDKLFQ